MKRLLFGLLVLVLAVMSLLTACQATSTTSSNTSSTTQSTITTSTASTSTTSTQANWWDKYGTPKYGGTISFAGGFMGLNLDNYQMVGAELDMWYNRYLSQAGHWIARYGR